MSLILASRSAWPAGYEFRSLAAEHEMRFRHVFSVIACLCHKLVLMKCRIHVFI